MEKYNQLVKKYSLISQPLKSVIDELLVKCFLEIEDGKEQNIFNDFKLYINKIKTAKYNNDNEIISVLNDLSHKSRLYGINNNLFKTADNSDCSYIHFFQYNIDMIDKINNKNIEKYYKDYETYKVNEYESMIDRLIENINKLQNRLKKSLFSKKFQNKISDNIVYTLFGNILNSINDSENNNTSLKNANKLYIEYLNSSDSQEIFYKLIQQMKEYKIDTSFWERQLQADKNNNKQDLFTHALTVCKKEISKEISKKIFENMQQQYDAFLDKLNQMINSLDSIFNRLKEMGPVGKLFQESLEDMAEQLWFDNSTGSINIKQFELIEEYASLLENNEEIQKICDIIGRLEQELLNISREKIQNVETYMNKIPVKHMKEDITGITLGRDISSLLPSEYSIMFDKDMEILFNLKYVENRLMMFESQSYLSQINTQYSEEEIEKKEYKEAEKGPVILCIDTSGSMEGMPEYLAKAMTLYIVTKAKKTDRDCFLINFSTEINTIDFKKGKNIKALMNFLQISFNGGTDAVPAFEKAIDMLQTEEYKKADILMISDFIYPYISDKLAKKINTEKKKGGTVKNFV